MSLLRTLLGTGSILVTLGLLAAAFAGVGRLARRAVQGRAGPTGSQLDTAFLDFWVGFGCVILFLLAWNFMLPVTDATLLVVLVAGAAGLWISRSELRGLAEEPLGRAAIAGLLLAGLWVSNLSLGPLNNYDSALYHLQAVQWAERFPAVPGIGNLDGPLAFNNANLLFDALLSAGPWQDRANHLANGLLTLVVAAQAIVGWSRIARRNARAPDVFRALLLVPAAAMPLHGRVSSLVTDIAPSLLILVAAALIYQEMVTREERSDSPAERRYRLFAIALLLATAVTCKSNAAVFAVAAFALSAAVAWTRGLRLAGLAPAIGIAGVMAAAWMGRGIILSGYPVFPLGVGGVNVEWRVPEEHAAAELAYIVHSGRASTQNLPVVAGEAGLGAWLPRWLRHALDDPYDIAIPLALALLGGLALLTRRRDAEAPAPSGNALVVPPLLAITAWFLSAPEPRYALPLFWVLAALALSTLFRRRVPARRSWTVWSLGLVGLGASPVVVSPILALESPYRREGPLAAIVKSNFNRAGTDGWFQPVEGKPEARPYRTRSGLLVTAVPERCWDAPLPCTPNPAPNLRLREPGNLARGFVVDGRWQMENWPMSWQPKFLEAWRRSRAQRD